LLLIIEVYGSRRKAQGSRLKAQGSMLKAQGSRLKAQGSRLKEKYNYSTLTANIFLYHLLSSFFSRAPHALSLIP
jgi:hypothetical protein